MKNIQDFLTADLKEISVDILDASWECFQEDQALTSLLPKDSYGIIARAYRLCSMAILGHIGCNPHNITKVNHPLIRDALLIQINILRILLLERSNYSVYQLSILLTACKGLLQHNGFYADHTNELIVAFSANLTLLQSAI